MRWTLPFLVVGPAACGGEEVAPPRYNVADMHGLEADAAWIWRAGLTGAVDTGRAGAVDEAALVWARHDGSGGIALRQGASWGTGEDWGWLQFQVGAGDLVLTEWDLPTDAGERLEGKGRIRMADAEAAHGDVHTSGAVVCETVINRGVETFFGRYEQTLTLVCTGPEDRPVGRWVFVREVGLVQLKSPTVTDLDLVRPGW